MVAAAAQVVRLVIRQWEVEVEWLGELETQFPVPGSEFRGQAPNLEPGTPNSEP
jgi:hypothetical protein